MLSVHPINNRSKDVNIHAIAADMAASHMSGRPVRPSVVPSFRFMYSESTCSDLDLSLKHAPLLLFLIGAAACA